MSLEEDEKWLKIVSGKDVESPADPQTAREADLLRNAILRKREQDEKDSPLEPGGAERLIFRLKREDLLITTEKKKRWDRPFPVAIAAMLVLAVVLPLAYQLTDTVENAEPEWTRMRGGTEIQNIQATDPMQAANSLVEELQSLGILAKLDEFQGRWYVEAYLPIPLTSPLKTFLERYKLSTGDDGHLILEIGSESNK